jgi:hypothetical protein
MSISSAETIFGQKPFVNGAFCLINGEVRSWSGQCTDTTSPILDENGNRIVIGKFAMMGESDAVEAALAAKAAWDTGRGVWPQMKTIDRIRIIEKVPLVVLLFVHDNFLW